MRQKGLQELEDAAPIPWSLAIHVCLHGERCPSAQGAGATSFPPGSV